MRLNEMANGTERKAPTVGWDCCHASKPLTSVFNSIWSKSELGNKRHGAVAQVGFKLVD